MKLFVALWLVSLPLFAGQFVEFRCEAPDASFIYKLVASGTLEIEPNSPDYTDAHAWIEATLIDAGYNSVATAINGVELKGLSKMIKDETLKPYYHIQLKPVDFSEVQVVNLLIGHPGSLSSFVRLKSGHEYRGKCYLR